MAFDRNSNTDKQKLSDEESIDPAGMGYSVVAGQTKNTLDLFNLAANNVGGEDIDETLTSDLLLQSIEPVDLTISNKFTQGQSDWLMMLLAASQGLEADLSTNRNKIVELFNQTPPIPTYTALVALKRLISRAEVLFGVGTVISRDDWFAARDYEGV